MSDKQKKIRKNARLNRKKIKEKAKIYRRTPLKFDGKVIYLGPKSDFKISEKSLSHIITGDFSERLIENDGRRTGVKERILSGGLHTYKAWVDFKNERKDVTHLRFYREGVDKYWYFARELHNNVITLKVPKPLFQNKAAKITEFPEVYYKSGYLWKTLFPKGKSKFDILKIINEALHNIDTDELSENLIIGYALLSSPYTAIKIRIQHRDKEIFSAFPTWDQPMTGNNGKAYSHLDSTSFQMALSTEFFDEKEKLFQPPESNVYDYRVGLTSLIDNTPRVLLERPCLPNADSKDEWMSLRNKCLVDFSSSCNEKEIEKLKKYVLDPIIIKDGFFLQRDIYDSEEILSDSITFNAITMFQNIYETLVIIFNYDQNKHTTHLKDILPPIILSKVTFSGYIDSWQNKLLHGRIIDLVTDYHDSELISEYFEAICESPTRNDFFIDFDLNIYWKEMIEINTHDDAMKIMLMHDHRAKIDLNERHFKDYVYNNLSENYHNSFTTSELHEIVNRIIDNQGENSKGLVFDTILLTTTNDFEFFSEKYNRLVNRLLNEGVTSISESSLSMLSKGVFRVQTACRMKIILRNPSFDLHKIDYGNPTTKKYFNDTITKHERRVNVAMLESFLDDTAKIAKENSFSKLDKQLSFMKERVWKERPPIAKPVPKKYRLWEHRKTQPWLKSDKPLVDLIIPKK